MRFSDATKSFGSAKLTSLIGIMSGNALKTKITFSITIHPQRNSHHCCRLVLSMIPSDFGLEYRNQGD